ncbi:hypothetical protein GDO78_008997 [Eleutherodactylus coqui]|uniref:Trifunctional purine biosynthetic protein adenosine-3 n=1 Tax=Eleutherodactylus coqui TaxID=57060 RepID=A0A8J6KC39_ELECQ|nr:hypothetical protein GDO78_008997 [Eleutherodactylus coqui]
MAETVLVIGSGAREHALAWKLAQSAHVKQVLVAPGNAGTASSGKISNSDVPTGDHTQLIKFCKSSDVSLVVVGPEAPLAAGLVDDLTAAGVRCFGPSARAAQLEASKSFAKDFMIRHKIPTAKYKSFTDAKEACDYINSADFPALVVKASGLAAGKGVVVASSKEEACKAVNDIMQCLCFSDGLTVAPMPPAQDHKRLLDGDEGPNTGGMGAYCPPPQVSKKFLDEIRDTVLQRAVNGIREEGAPYVGVLYAGLMLTKDGPKVLEFNCRFGDPECQVILPLLQSDLYAVMQATVGGRLAASMPVWLEDHAAVTVVMASGGYPGSYNKGLEITGLSTAEDLGLEVFHAGTALKDKKVVTSGGRVLTVTAVRKDLLSALEEANKGVSVIAFSGAAYRKDIGFRAIAYLKQHRRLTYKDSGVDIEAGNSLIAQACNKHDTIGQDLVAMCVNDILAQGAEPLFFLDYFGCGSLDVSVAESVVSGIASACQMAGCALLGGETAEMPGMYAPGEYDLAGFAVGAVERGRLLPLPEEVTAGDLVIGVSSSGVHSNGFNALCWKIPGIFSWLQREGGLSDDEMSRTFNCGIGAVLLVKRMFAEDVLKEIQAVEDAWIVGEVTLRQTGSESVEIKNLTAALNRTEPEPQKYLSTSICHERPAVEGRVRVAVLISGTGKILNVHPSLLPSFKGAHAHELVLEAGVRVSGCTVHFVAEEVDAGAIVYQEAVPVEFGDTVHTLSERVKTAEHRAFPAALQLVASGAAKLGEDGKIQWSRSLAV